MDRMGRRQAHTSLPQRPEGIIKPGSINRRPGGKHHDRLFAKGFEIGTVCGYHGWGSNVKGYLWRTKEACYNSSTTFQIVKSLKQNIHILQGAAVISLLQPSPETFDLFDDVILLSDGKIVHQGPREHVLEFFESMGFKCPERKGVADFLQEVSVDIVNEFAEAFQSFHEGRRLQDELAIPFDKSKSHPAALTTHKYGASKKELLKACFSREFLLMKRNSFVYIFKLSQLTIMAVIASTLFLRTKMHHDLVNDGGIYAAALFFCVVINLFNGMVELSMTIARLPVFYKQRDLLFYPN
uniref:ABC-2 type transporter domain-containing protein n=1 Tax=Fagus sylvatica TaxID=28930 RepID=A0A2N9FEV4_FAGSY